jgi:predicted Zn-dependent peptidase
VDSFQDVAQKINAISNDEIKTVAKQILSPEKINVLIYK